MLEVTNPSIRIEKLNKTFETQIAVNDISLVLSKGTILGFLGPNGAGKSTTMRMITGYIKPTKGSIEICGHNMIAFPRIAKTHIGYLPENNPLYLDMYVKEYLEFMAQIRGMSKNKILPKIDEIIKKCDIEDMSNKKIRVLSKGYRQRVGLAQTLVHDPAILILDEPTSGLDPNQITEIRNLIKNISDNKIVILSTHIMQEVEAICNEVLILDHGKIIIHDTLEKLSSNNECALKVEFKQNILPASLSKLVHIKKVQTLTESVYMIYTDNHTAAREEIFLFAKNNSLILLGLEKSNNMLNDMFKRFISNE